MIAVIHIYILFILNAQLHIDRTDTYTLLTLWPLCNYYFKRDSNFKE